MDVVSISMLVKRRSGPVRRERGILIASVITPEEKRGRGYCSRMLNEYFEAHSQTSGILYSDIGPPFYARYGFYERPIRCVEIPAESVHLPETPLAALSLEVFASELSQWRARALELAPESDAAVLDPEGAWLDWQVERYRFFAERSKTRLGELFFLLDHSTGKHLLGAVPDFISGRLDAFWTDPDCSSCLTTLHHLASAQGLSLLRFWTRHDAAWRGKTEYPMLRIAGGGTTPTFIDPQFCDWW
jgi:hypothetical protein